MEMKKESIILLVDHTNGCMELIDRTYIVTKENNEK